VVGAHAVAFHARPRATKELDLWVEPTPKNARRAVSALRDFFGGADPGIMEEELALEEWIFQLGVAPVRVDLVTHIKGLPDFSVAWERREEGFVGDVPAPYLGLEELIAAKAAAGRPQDRVDLRSLRAALARSRRGPRA
jgi:hypothetical protein